MTIDGLSNGTPVSSKINTKLAALINTMDADGDGNVTESEFSKIFSSTLDKKKTAALSFEKLSGGKDTMSVADLTAALQSVMGHHHSHHHYVDATTGATAPAATVPPVTSSTTA